MTTVWSVDRIIQTATDVQRLRRETFSKMQCSTVLPGIHSNRSHSFIVVARCFFAIIITKKLSYWTTVAQYIIQDYGLLWLTWRILMCNGGQSEKRVQRKYYPEYCEPFSRVVASIVTNEISVVHILFVSLSITFDETDYLFQRPSFCKSFGLN